MRIGLTGSSGLIGSELNTVLKAAGHFVIPIKRSEFGWGVSGEGFEALDAVVHLGAETINAWRWTKAKKRRIMESRVSGTRRLTEALSRLEHPPRSFLCASAVGFYGDRGSTPVNETSHGGSGFLAGVCKEWEAAAASAADFSARTALLRFGVVLSLTGGALPQMLLPFKYRCAFVPGDPQSYLSWISLTDACGAVAHCLQDESLSGPVNVTSPQPATNADFVEAFSAALRTVIKLPPAPSWLIRLALGQMGQELLLSSTRVLPQRLLESAFVFTHPSIADYVAAINDRVTSGAVWRGSGGKS